jgi:hypothetical protein
MSTVLLTFEGGHRHGEVLACPEDDLPAQDAFDGYWIEDMIVNDHMCAVPIAQATPNGWSPFGPPPM